VTLARGRGALEQAARPGAAAMDTHFSEGKLEAAIITGPDTSLL
jgi:hypothetical protein